MKATKASLIYLQPSKTKIKIPPSKPVIAVDVDGVLADFVPAIIKWHNLTHHTSLTLDDIIHYDLWRAWGGTPTEGASKMHAFYQSPYFLEIEPIKGSAQAIRQLSQKYNLCIATAREKLVQKETAQWIRRHFSDHFLNMLFGGHPSHQKIQIPKLEMCRQSGASIFIDDSLDYTAECAAAGIRTLLFGQYPWNQAATLAPGVERTRNWDEVTRLLLA